ncbi:MAG: hypothetical protein RMY28_027765 [Nostoc sp. ChiSLP01]|nr:hypothetical protein [Nostoc sp. CmiSLP01]MDZ8285719.1 hypothetical protein [Nostoc sp. ChiSLP01]
MCASLNLIVAQIDEKACKPKTPAKPNLYIKLASMHIAVLRSLEQKQYAWVKEIYLLRQAREAAEARGDKAPLWLFRVNDREIITNYLQSGVSPS